jgi:hypothetical protein
MLITCITYSHIVLCLSASVVGAGAFPDTHTILRKHATPTSFSHNMCPHTLPQVQEPCHTRTHTHTFPVCCLLVPRMLSNMP